MQEKLVRSDFDISIGTKYCTERYSWTISHSAPLCGFQVLRRTLRDDQTVEVRVGGSLGIDCIILCVSILVILLLLSQFCDSFYISFCVHHKRKNLISYSLLFLVFHLRLLIGYFLVFNLTSIVLDWRRSLTFSNIFIWSIKFDLCEKFSLCPLWEDAAFYKKKMKFFFCSWQISGSQHQIDKNPWPMCFSQYKRAINELTEFKLFG